MKNMITIMLLFVAPLFAIANQGGQHQAGIHTPDVCLTDAPTVCAHLKFAKVVTATEEAPFILHFLVPADVSASVSDVKVVLWMDMGHGHGHGSAPVVLTQKTPDHYLVTNAFFMMEGEWMVRVDFMLAGVARHLEIPVEVQ